MIEAYKFAKLDTFRAVTHNKGIINGIEAVSLATGQDCRAINSSLHGFAAIMDNNSKYSPLSTYEIIDDKTFVGRLSVPLSVGSQGGVL